MNDRMIDRVYSSELISSQVLISIDLVKKIRIKRLCHNQFKTRVSSRWNELGHVLNEDQGLHLFDPNILD